VGAVTFFKPFGVGTICLDILCWLLPYPKEGFGFGFGDGRLRFGVGDRGWTDDPRTTCMFLFSMRRSDERSRTARQNRHPSSKPRPIWALGE